MVCATHRDLTEMVEDGDFREDLMFRINTFEIHSAAAAGADRRHSANWPSTCIAASARGRRPDDEMFSPETPGHAVERTRWPGNVRELANVIEHATILCDEPPITPKHLPQTLRAREAFALPDLGPISLRDLEMHAIHQSLDRHDGNKPVAAEELGISLKTLYNKLNQANTEKRSA